MNRTNIVRKNNNLIITCKPRNPVKMKRDFPKTQDSAMSMASVVFIKIEPFFGSNNSITFTYGGDGSVIIDLSQKCVCERAVEFPLFSK